MAKFKHIEIAGVNGAALESFYGELFDWKITQREVGGFMYRDIETNGDLTAGIREEPEGKAEVVAWVEVDDLDASFASAKSLGAAVRIEPMAYGDLRFALVEDPEGNPVGLLQAKDA
ncbi:VOC domain-containing protein [Sulfidibacter corallicola]|uniref:VOC domain-containing protein n=1 Tax=Sulfidibacter corallicola TaxID=2818388 RepID=A0A8A4TV78_SULCO|nr:VOC family protein [Sulfidibacter corallicola]QTD53393.1 hypothetical protein J3U87_13140 [Sulfidibacter corallicola]